MNEYQDHNITKGQMAINHYQQRLLTIVFGQWIRYCQESSEEMQEKLELAKSVWEISSYYRTFRRIHERILIHRPGSLLHPEKQASLLRLSNRHYQQTKEQIFINELVKFSQRKIQYHKLYFICQEHFHEKILTKAMNQILQYTHFTLPQRKQIWISTLFYRKKALKKYFSELLAYQTNCNFEKEKESKFFWYYKRNVFDKFVTKIRIKKRQRKIFACLHYEIPFLRFRHTMLRKTIQYWFYGHCRQFKRSSRHYLYLSNYQYYRFHGKQVLQTWRKHIYSQQPMILNEDNNHEEHSPSLILTSQLQKINNYKGIWFWKLWRINTGFQWLKSFANRRKRQRQLFVQAKITYQQNQLQEVFSRVVSNMFTNSHSIYCQSYRQRYLARKYCQLWKQKIIQIRISRGQTPQIPTSPPIETFSLPQINHIIQKFKEPLVSKPPLEEEKWLQLVKSHPRRSDFDLTSFPSHESNITSPQPRNLISHTVESNQLINSMYSNHIEEKQYQIARSAPRPLREFSPSIEPQIPPIAQEKPKLKMKIPKEIKLSILQEVYSLIQECKELQLIH